MKKILFTICVLWSAIVFAQPNYIPGYLTVNENRNQRMFIARAFNLPVGTTPTLQTGQWVGFGGLYADSTGGNKGIHYYNGVAWVRLADTTYTGFSKDRFGFSGEDVTAAASRTFAQGIYPFNWTTGGAMGTNVSPFKIAGTPTSYTGATYRMVDITTTGTIAGSGKSLSSLYVANEVVHSSGSNVAIWARAARNANDINMAFVTDSGSVNIGHVPGTAFIPARMTVRTDEIHADPSELDGLWLVNYANADAVNPLQFSPPLVLYGAVWDSSGVDSAKTVYFDIYAEPIQGATDADAKLIFDSYISGVEIANAFTIGMNGQVGVNNGDYGTNGQVMTSQGPNLPAKWAAGGGGSQGLQDVITVDNNLTGAHNIISTNDDFSWDDFLSYTIDAQAFVLPSIATGSIDTTTNKPLGIDAAGSVIAMNSWAQVSGGGGASGITVGTTAITSGTDTRVAFNNAGVYGEDAGLTFNPTTNLLTVTGPSADLANGPKMNYNFNSDANPALSYFFYTHDNLAITMDSYYNGGWVSSDATSNFLLYKNAGELKVGYNTGTAAGSSFSPNLTDGVRFTNNGRMGIGVAATAKVHIVASTTAANTGSLKINEGSRQTTPEDGTINYVANNLEFVETSTVYTLAKTLTATATLNFDLSAVNSQDLTITVTGAASGDAVSLGLDPASVSADITFFGWVSASNTVTIRCSRVGGGGAADPASGTFRASVIKY